MLVSRSHSRFGPGKKRTTNNFFIKAKQQHQKKNLLDAHVFGFCGFSDGICDLYVSICFCVVFKTGEKGIFNGSSLVYGNEDKNGIKSLLCIKGTSKHLVALNLYESGMQQLKALKAYLFSVPEFYRSLYNRCYIHHDFFCSTFFSQIIFNPKYPLIAHFALLLN